MAGSPKKTKAEKAQTRKAANMRYRQKKRAEGMTMVSIWIPASLAKTIEGKEKIGLIVADPEDHAPPMCAIWKNKTLEEILWQKNLIDITREK